MRFLTLLIITSCTSGEKIRPVRSITCYSNGIKIFEGKGTRAYHYGDEVEFRDLNGNTINISGDCIIR